MFRYWVWVVTPLIHLLGGMNEATTLYITASPSFSPGPGVKQIYRLNAVGLSLLIRLFKVL
jgi:hypothetical protein